jgi:hypothetical protein
LEGASSLAFSALTVSKLNRLRLERREYGNDNRSIRFAG